MLALEEEGSAKHAELAAELKERQKKLDELMESFAVRGVVCSGFRVVLGTCSRAAQSSKHVCS